MRSGARPRAADVALIIVLSGAAAEIVSMVLLAVVLGFALIRPHELPELIAAAPAAGRLN